MSDKFKIGDNVVALKSNPDNFSQPRVKGKVYEVLDLLYCCKCGSQFINIVSDPISINKITCKCGSHQLNYNQWFTHSEHFVKVDDIEAELEEAVENENYDLAITLRDIKKEMV